MSVLRACLCTLAVVLSACVEAKHDPERHVLTGNDTNLFFQTQLPIDPRKADEIIAEVKSFALEHDMDLLVARESLPPGDFNVSANAPTINIRAMHAAAVGDAEVMIFAIVPDAVTQTDKELVGEFVTKLRSIR